MRRNQNKSGRKNEQGIVIMLVAVVMLFVVGAMAALSIDVVTLYTARSEAQLAAAGARQLGDDFGPRSSARVQSRNSRSYNRDPSGREQHGWWQELEFYRGVRAGARNQRLLQ